MVQFCLDDLMLPYPIHAFSSKILHLESKVLAKNPLGDPPWRQNYVLIPHEEKKKLPVIFHLSGYFSTGYQSFNYRTLDINIPQWLDEDTSSGKIPPAIHVFVDAMTFWGGSQFIDSPGCGNYTKYIFEELCPAVASSLNCSNNWWLVGGSSGGYGALHLLSSKGSPFKGALAIAPDSFFEASLLPEIFKVGPQLANYKDLNEIRSLIKKGELQDKRSFFPLMNVIAMAHCYAPKGTVTKKQIKWPIDLHTGVVDEKLWKSWLQQDPIRFLPKRMKNLKGKKVYLDVGRYDEYSLQFGTRQIAKVLKKGKVGHKLTEFSGTHRGLSQRRRVLMKEYHREWKP